MTNANTVYVNASYDGELENGTYLNPYKSLDAAIASLSSTHRSASALYLANGLYTLSNQLSVPKTFYIVGESAEDTIISSNRHLIFSIVGSRYVFSIFNLTLTGGKYHYGGAIYINQSTVNIVNTIFKDNEAEGTSEYAGAGGAIYNEGGLCNIFNGTFINNKASSTEATYAGAIYNDLGTTVVLNSNFINNSVVDCSYGAGGAIYNFNSFLTVFNSSFVNNTVYGNYALGGAIASFEAHNVFIINSTVDSNRLCGNYTFAGGIFNKAALLEIINSTVSNNVAEGFSLSNSTVFNLAGIYHLINSTFENNVDFNSTIIELLNKSNTAPLMVLEDQIIVSQAFTDEELADLPSKYDLREHKWVTGAKDQGYSGSCWAFAVYGALESYLLKNENITYDFSENNMKNVMGSYGINGTDWTDGGNYQMALAYLLRWSGPVTESQDYYGAYSIIPNYIDEITKHVQGVMYVPLRLSYLDNSQIKAAILRYGALYTSIFGEDLGNPHYNSLSNIPNHAVCIVGWDDNYSASNFRGIKPPGDGAFIIKNSWGNDYGDKGFGYVSYYDKTLAGYGLDSLAALAFTEVEDLTNYGNVYQYDILGNTYESIGFGSNTAWFANQFISESDTNLSAFGLYAYGDSEYLVNVYVNGDKRYSQNGTIAYAGYHTIKFNELVEILKDDVFKIEVKLTTFDSLFPIAIESKRIGYSSKANASLNQSFVSLDGEDWYDIGGDTEIIKFTTTAYGSTLHSANVCLKAYTVNLAELTLSINSNATYYFKDDLVRVSYNLTNLGDYARDIRLNFSLDDSLVIVKELCSCTKGLYNSSIGLWTINELYKGESIFVNFVFNMSSNKEIVNIQTFVNCSSDALGNYKTYDFNLYHDGAIRLLNDDKDISDMDISTLTKSNEEFKIKLSNVLNDSVSNKAFALLIFNGDGDLVNSTDLISDENGELSLVFDLLEGNYTFNLQSEEDERYDLTNVSFHVNAKKINTYIDLDLKNITIFSLSNYGISFDLFDENGHLINDSTVQIVIKALDSNAGSSSSNSSSSGDLDNYNVFKSFNVHSSDGRFNFDLNLLENDYMIFLSYLGDDYLGSCEKSFNAKVIKQKTKIISTKLTTTSVVLKSDKGSYFKAYLKDGNNKPLAGKKVQVKLNGKTYNLTSDKNGLVKLYVKLAKSGTYKVSMSFKGDDKYIKSSSSNSIKVNPKKAVLSVPVKKFKASSKSKVLTATLKDKNKKAVKGKKLIFTINGKKYTAKTNSKGIAKVKVKLSKKKTYKFSVKFNGDKYYYKVTKTSKCIIK